MQNKLSKYILCCFILLINVNLLSSSNYTAIIKINQSECLKCYFAQGAISLLDSEIEKKLLFKSQKQANIDRYIDLNFPIDKSSFQLLISDSLYNLYDNEILSEFYLLNRNEIHTSFKMRHIWTNIESINEIVKEKTLTLKSELDFYSAKLFLINDNTIVFDKSQQTVSIFNNHGKLIDFFDNSYFNVYDLQKMISNSAHTLYLEHYSQLKSTGYADLVFSQVKVSNNDLIIGVQIPDITEERDENGEKRIIVNKIPAIIIKSLDYKNKNYELYKFNLKSLKDGYYVKLDDFSKIAGDILIPTYKVSKDEGKNYCFGLYRIDEKHKEISFVEFLDFELPEIFIEDDITKSYINLQPLFNKEASYFRYSNRIFLQDHNMILKTPFTNENYFVDYANMRIVYDFVVHDIYYDIHSGFISLMFSNSSNQLFIASKSIYNEDYQTEELKLDNYEKLVGFVQFSSKDKIVYLTLDDILHIKSL